MGDELEQVMATTAENAFEQLGFLWPDLDAEDDPDTDGLDFDGMLVRFYGHREGALLVRVEASLMQLLAENMLALDEAPPRGLQLDALGEVANVICGNLLPLVAGPAAEFRLDGPILESQAGRLGPVRASTRLKLDGGVAEITLFEGVS